MGRYYSGDIEGKFWVAVQSSDDPSFFGGEIREPSYISYYFDKENLNQINEGLKTCLEKLGEFKEKLDKFFNEDGKDGYNDEMITKKFLISDEKVRELLEWYARLELGEKIKKCIEENGECSFEAEL